VELIIYMLFDVFVIKDKFVYKEFTNTPYKYSSCFNYVVDKMAMSLTLPPYPAIWEDGRQKGSRILMDNNGFHFRLKSKY
jgi:hypothetical protein